MSAAVAARWARPGEKERLKDQLVKFQAAGTAGSLGKPKNTSGHLLVFTREYFREANRRWTEKNPEKVKVLARNARNRAKSETLAHYSDGKCVCVQCGENDIDVLNLDHINNDGAHRRREGKNNRGYILYRRLRREGWPSGYQTLCANCNLKKEIIRKREV